MLVERTREDGRGELLIPSRVIFWVAGILFFLSFLSYDIIDFPGMKKESPTSWHLVRWHLLVWTGLGGMFWAGWNRFTGKEGLLAGKIGRLLSKLVIKFPFLVERKYIFDPSKKAVIVSTKTGERTIESTGAGRIRIRKKSLPPKNPDSSPLTLMEVEYLDKDDQPQLIYEAFFHYISARRIAERAAKTLRVPLDDQVTGEERPPDELDRPLWKIPVSKPKSLPWSKKKNEWGFRRTADGFRGTLGVTASAMIGTFVCAIIIGCYFFFLSRPNAPDSNFIYILAAIFGTLAFFWVTFNLPVMMGARTTLEIGPTETRYGLFWLGRWFMAQSIPTESVEAIYGKYNLPCLVSDDLVIFVGGNNSLSEEELDRFGHLLHWMIRTVVLKAKEANE